MRGRTFTCLLVVLLLTGACSRSPELGSSSIVVTRAEAPPGNVVLPPGSPKLERIRVDAVHMAPFPADEISAPGKVEADPHRISRVVMPLPGRVREVHVNLGDAVTAGQVLLTIDSPEASAAVTACRQAQSQLRQAQSALQKAEADLSRLRDLYEHRAAPFKEVQRAESDLTQSQTAVEQAQAGRDAALHRLAALGLKPEQATQELIVRAPLAGKVLEVSVVPGEYRNDTSASLITIADLRTVWIAADVPESSIRLIELGEAVEVELAAYPGEVFRGRVMRIADTVDPQTRTVKVRTELRNDGGRLRPEMFGKIRHSHGWRTLPAVPAAAVVRTGGAASVFMERSAGHFQQVQVTPGEASGDLIPILSGLKAGDRIVVDGAILLVGR